MPVDATTELMLIAALPGDVTTCSITFGTYTDAAGNPLASLTGRLFPVDPGTGRRVRLVNSTTGHVFLPSDVPITITAGVGTVGPIPHTDNTSLSPTGFAYRIEWDVASSRPSPGNRNVLLPSAAGPAIDYDLLIDADTVTGADVAQPAVTSVAGLTGAPSAEQVADALEGALSTAFVARDAVPNRVTLLSSFAGGEDDGAGTDSTGRLNLESYQRADVGSFGETIRHFLRRKDAKAMEAWWFPRDGYDANREPVGPFKPVVWAGAHWEANNHASNHKHWSVETPDSTGAIQTRFEVRFGNPAIDNAIGGLDKTIIATNLADFVVRTTNGQVLRLSSPASSGDEKAIEFNHDYEGSTAFRRWRVRATGEAESTGNAGTNFQIARYDDTGTFLDNPLVISRATGNVTLGPGFIARRASASASSVSLNTTSLGGGIGVVALGNAPTVPASNPTGGGVLYAEAGALKWRGSSGTVTVVAPA